MLNRFFATLILLLACISGASGEELSPGKTDQVLCGRIEFVGDGLSLRRDGQADLVLSFGKDLTRDKVVGFLRMAKDRELECIVTGSVVSDVRVPEDGHITFRCLHCACRMSLKSASQWEEPCKSCDCGKSNGACYGDYR